jgi:hypothetical protein
VHPVRTCTRCSRSRRSCGGAGLLPSVRVLLFGVLFPRLVELWIGRGVTWLAAACEWPALVVFVAAALLASSITLLARA